jgi:hypothetical protein
MITERQYARDVTPNDIKDLIQRRQTETKDLEFKRSSDADLLKEACGLANAGGGFILIGVDEDDQHCASAVVHVEGVLRVEDSVRQQLRDGLAPRPVIEVAHLSVNTADMIVIRISPQNPPHMVATGDRSDFYGRYDSSTKRMRYEEIEQSFRNKHESGALSLPETPKSSIETIGGRMDVSSGSAGALEAYVARVRTSQKATLAFMAVSDGNLGSVDESDAISMLRSPLYNRQGGWLVAHPGLEVTPESGLWAQKYGPSSTTSINASGDLIFLKSVDEVLCSTQDEAAFRISPRFYPNAIADYCLSFAYLVADIAARTHPRKIFIQPLISDARGANLPRGEGGSVWFSSPVQKPRTLDSDFARGPAIPIEAADRKAIRARHVAFQIAAQVYSFFGYLESDVAFASDGELTQESDPDVETLRSLRTYLQNVLGVPVHKTVKDFERDIYWLMTTHLGITYRIGATEDFIEDRHITERKFFAELDGYDIRALVDKLAPAKKPLVLTNEGPQTISPS